MKIAFVYDAIYPYILGGVQKRNWELARRLVRRGHEVTLFGMKSWEGEDIIYKEGVRLWGVCPPQELFVNGRRSIKQAIYFAWKVLPALLKERFDIIDCQEFPYFPCFSAKFHSLFKKSKLIITWYETWDNYWFEYLGKKGIFGWAIERLTAKLPVLMIPILEQVNDDLKRLKVPENTVRVVPNGVDFYKLRNLESNGVSDIIYAGRLASHKNVGTLLEAVSLVKKQFPNVSCKIIGNGPEMEKLRILSDELRLNDSVEFLGFIESDEEVYARMRASKIFVLPSTREGFPNTILEANSCGLPAIIINHENNAGVGVVRHGYNGFVVNLSPEEIAERIVCLLENKAELNRLSRNAVEFARDYDWSIIVERIEGIYKEALS